MVDTAADPMLAIWESVAQALPTGEKVIIWRNRNDLDFLYESGFVDTDRWKKEDWIDAFQDTLQADGSYRVTKERWLANRRFRFDGPTGEPFDPLSMREGAWENEDFERLLKEKIFPATTVSADILRKGIEKARDRNFINGKFILTKAFKFNVKQMVQLLPSPRRVREFAVSEARLGLQKKTPQQGAVPAKAAQPTKSGYTTGPSKEQSMADRLNRLLSKK